jgi:hypothetical protein
MGLFFELFVLVDGPLLALFDPSAMVTLNDLHEVVMKRKDRRQLSYFMRICDSHDVVVSHHCFREVETALNATTATHQEGTHGDSFSIKHRHLLTLTKTCYAVDIITILRTRVRLIITQTTALCGT